MRRIESVVHIRPQLLGGVKVDVPEASVEHPSRRADLFAVPRAWDMG